MPGRKVADESANILIIDDNPDNRLLLASQLGMHGYSILEAGSGKEGIEIAQEQQPDLILLDVMMPIMNGFEVCTYLKADDRTTHIPIIMVTALRDIEYRIRGIEVGADEFLSRPHHREELLVRVRSLIRLKQARDKLEEERHRLRLLYDVSRATTSSQLDLDQMLVEIISHTQAAVEAIKGSIILVNPQREITHKIIARAGGKPEMSDQITSAVLDKGLAGWLLYHKRGDIITDAGQDDRWIILPDDTEEVGSAIGVPLLASEVAMGVLILVHPHVGYFREEHVALLETIAGQATVAIRNAYLFVQISEQRQKLSAILAQSSDAIITTNEDFKIELINHAAEMMFNLAADNVVGIAIDEIRELNLLTPLFEEAKAQPVSEELPLSDRRTILSSITPIRGIGYMAVLQDITQIKENEEMRLEKERQAKAQVEETFSRYMSPRLVEQVLSNEPGLLADRQRRSAVVLFADLRGFTRMIIDLNPSESINILNDFFTEMTEIVYQFDGTIFDLIGDELMVGFNVPLAQKDAAIRSVRTAIAMQNRFDELRVQWFASTGTELGLGIGVDLGNVVMGNVGAETRMNFAMVGEAVNTASRLVDIAQDGHIVISEGVFQAIKDQLGSMDIGAEAFRSLGHVSLKGKPSPQLIYLAEMARTTLEAVMGH